MKNNKGQFKKGQHYSLATEFVKGFSANPATQFKKGEHISQTTEFKKGIKPWNTGLKGVQISTRKGKKYPEKQAENHVNWKGDNVGYSALHAWIKIRLAKPLGCNHCGKIKLLDLANKSGEYKRELDDWFWLCRICHKKYDLSFNVGEKRFLHRIERITI